MRWCCEAEFCLTPGDPAAIRGRMTELLEQRRASQPLEFPSAGSTFKRPEGYYAGTLIDQCGLKGLTVGGAQVSEKHAGFVINRGGATCADVKELIRQVQERVFAQAGVRLEPEVRIIDLRKGRCGHGNPHHLRPLRGREEQGGLLFGGHGLLYRGQYARRHDPEICGALRRAATADTTGWPWCTTCGRPAPSTELFRRAG